MKSTDPNVIKVHDLKIEKHVTSVTIKERTVRLSVKEAAILELLATEPTRVFSKEELLQTVWGYRSIGHTRTLDAHCSALRRKLDPDYGRYVVNCWGVGYRLVGP